MAQGGRGCPITLSLVGLILSPPQSICEVSLGKNLNPELLLVVKVGSCMADAVYERVCQPHRLTFQLLLLSCHSIAMTTMSVCYSGQFSEQTDRQTDRRYCMSYITHMFIKLACLTGCNN